MIPLTRLQTQNRRNRNEPFSPADFLRYNGTILLSATSLSLSKRERERESVMCVIATRLRDALYNMLNDWAALSRARSPVLPLLVREKSRKGIGTGA